MIPKQINQLYHKLGLKVGLYIKSRWLCCPFKKIEGYLPKSGIIFDIGCGYGLLANYLTFSSAERKVIGVDLDAARINIAKKTVGQRKNIEFLQEDVKNLNLRDCRGVVMTDFLHHIPPNVSQDIFKLIYEKLSSQGKLVIQEVDKFPRWKYFITIFIDRLLNIGEPLYHRPAEEWKKILENTGFQVKIIPIHQGLFLSDVLLICTKNENNPNT